MTMTEAKARTIVDSAVTVLNEFEKYLNENTDTTAHQTQIKYDFVTHADALLIASREVADWASGVKHPELEQSVHASVSAFRAGLSSVKGQAAAFLTQPLRILGRYYGFTETDPEIIIDKIAEYFRDKGIRVQSRNLTVGAASPGRVSGSANTSSSGVLHTLALDVTGDPINNLWPETIEFRCTHDEHSGATEHREVFSISGDPLHDDGITIAGSGATGTTTALTPSSSLALNPSFTSYGSSLTSPSFTNWTATGGDIDADDSVYYRNSMGEATPISLKFNANAKLVQSFSDRNLTLDTKRPYFFHLAYKPSSTATGTLSVKVGSQGAQTVAFDGSVNPNWQIKNHYFWFDAMNEENPDFEIELTSLGGSGSPTLNVDDFIVAPFSEFNGLYYCIVGGEKPFRREDRFTVAITQPSGTAIKGLLNEWLWKAYNKYLPCEASPTTPHNDWKDPTGYV